MAELKETPGGDFDDNNGINNGEEEKDDIDARSNELKSEAFETPGNPSPFVID